MCVSKPPKPPAPPPPPPPPPEPPLLAEASGARRKVNDEARRRAGTSGTILTSSQGVIEPAVTGKKTLLGA